MNGKVTCQAELVRRRSVGRHAACSSMYCLGHTQHRRHRVCEHSSDRPPHLLAGWFCRLWRWLARFGQGRPRMAWYGKWRSVVGCHPKHGLDSLYGRGRPVSGWTDPARPRHSNRCRRSRWRLLLIQLIHHHKPELERELHRRRAAHAHHLSRPATASDMR